jgi:hypothetical protein
MVFCLAKAVFSDIKLINFSSKLLNLTLISNLWALRLLFMESSNYFISSNVKLPSSILVSKRILCLLDFVWFSHFHLLSPDSKYSISSFVKLTHFAYQCSEHIAHEIDKARVIVVEHLLQAGIIIITNNNWCLKTHDLWLFVCNEMNTITQTRCTNIDCTTVYLNQDW